MAIMPSATQTRHAPRGVSYTTHTVRRAGGAARPGTTPTRWALRHPAQLDPSARCVLALLADHADANGRGAVITGGAIAETLGLKIRAVRTILADLRAAGLISAGDQKLVEDLPANRRPSVWDLGMGISTAGAQ